MIRRSLALGGLSAAAACAGMQPPPGGPVDKSPPTVVHVTPDSGTVGQRPRAVTFTFDETVSDRPARGGLDQYFLISPMDGDPRVAWHRSRIDVRPRHDFRANTAYTVTLLPGLADIRGNVMPAGTSVTFSTGASFPAFGIEGHIFDWAAERPAAHAIVTATAHADSTVYITAADSNGAYALGPFGPGAYTVEGYIDQNANRTRDRGEAWDSHEVVISVSRPVIELLAILRDTIPPHIQTVTRDDSATIRVTFDRALDPSETLTPALFRVQRADSTTLPIAEVLTLRQADARADSLRRIAGDTAHRADTTRRADTTAARTAQPPSVVPLPTGVSPVPGVPGARTGPPTGPRPSRPPPPTTVVLKLAPPAVLEPSTTYRITARDMRNLMGHATTSEHTLTIPKPPPPPKTPAATPAPARKPGG